MSTVAHYALVKLTKFKMLYRIHSKNIFIFCTLSILFITTSSSKYRSKESFDFKKSIPIEKSNYSIIEYNYEQRKNLGLFKNNLVVFSEHDFDIYTSNGNLLTSLGNKGRGPNEYMILRYAVEKQDSLLMVDTGQMKVDWFDQSFQYIKTTPIKFRPTNDLKIVGNTFIFTKNFPINNKMIGLYDIYQESELSFHNPLVPIGKQPQTVNYSFLDTYNSFVYTKFVITDSLYKYSIEGNHIKTYHIEYESNRKLFNPTIDEISTSNNYKITGTFLNFRFISDTKFVAIVEGYLILFELQINTFKAINGLQIIDNENYFSAVTQIEIDKEYFYLNSKAINSILKIPVSIFEE